MSAATRKLREALAVWDDNVRAAEQAASVTARMRTLGDLLIAGGYVAEAARAALPRLVEESNGQEGVKR